MKINGFELIVVCANYDKDFDSYGDIYTCVEECLEEHPEDEVIYGFNLIKEGINTPDWFDTIEEAIRWASDY